MKTAMYFEGGEPVLKLIWSNQEYSNLNKFLTEKLGMTAVYVNNAFGVHQNLKVYATENADKAGMIASKVTSKLNTFYERGNNDWWGEGVIIDDISKPVLQTTGTATYATFNMAPLRVVPEDTADDTKTVTFKFSKDKLFDFGKVYPAYLRILTNACNVLKTKSKTKKIVEIDIDRVKVFR